MSSRFWPLLMFACSKHSMVSATYCAAGKYSADAYSGCTSAILNSLDVGEAVITSPKLVSSVIKVGAGESTKDASLGLKMVKIRPRITGDYGTIW